MNSFFLIFIGLPALEVFLMIKIGAKIGAFNTISLIFLTAVIGIYFAKKQGIETLRLGMLNSYRNQIPIYEMISGASIAIAALLLIIPGFMTDTIGFLLLIPVTRKIIITFFVKRKKVPSNNKTLDGEIIENEKDEL